MGIIRRPSRAKIRALTTVQLPHAGVVFAWGQGPDRDPDGRRGSLFSLWSFFSLHAIHPRLPSSRTEEARTCDGRETRP